MCGLTGVISRAPSAQLRQRIRRATASLAHRGPDGEGYFESLGGDGAALVTLGTLARTLRPTHVASGCGVVFGHRRLSIIDRSNAGAQPFVSDDDRYVLMLNGEIYNYVELRDELRLLGATFRSASDTEVLLAAWVQWGTACLHRLTGMFAFSVFDRRDGLLTIARDAFGMKPMFFTRNEREFCFASEIATLLELSQTPPNAAPAGLGRFLFSGVTDEAHDTMFVGVSSLPAAHLVQVRVSGVAEPLVQRWWSPDLATVVHRSPAQLATELREMIEGSVRIHLRSEVPVGTLLSGGLDSSTIVSVARRIAGASADVRTFSYIPESGAQSEQQWIDQVNAATNARSVIVRPSHAEWEATMDHLVRAQGEPFGTPAVFVQSQLFAAAAEAGVTVLLDGQGADELFGGYSFARAARMAGHLRRGELLSALRFNMGVGRSLGGGWRHSPLRGAIALMGASTVRRVRVRRGAAAMGGLAHDAWFAERGVVPEPAWTPGGPRVLQERLWFATERASLPALLRYADRSAMSVSVESRLPFLTTAMAEFAFSLPDQLLVDDAGVGKRIVRSAMRGVVPDTVLNRRDKIGFAVPMESWLLRSARAPALLSAAAGLPCVNARVAERMALMLRAGRPLRAVETLMAWRLIGLATWANAYGVRFDL